MEVFNDLKIPLVIVGSGRKKQTQKMAGRFITFLEIFRTTIKRNLPKSIALLFPMEDFGIIPLGHLVAETGTAQKAELETVIPGSTGLSLRNKQEALKNRPGI